MTTEIFPLSYAPEANRNNVLAELVETAVRRDEGQLTHYGALAVETGEHTGRSAQDKFTVRDAITQIEAATGQTVLACVPPQKCRMCAVAPSAMSKTLTSTGRKN